MRFWSQPRAEQRAAELPEPREQQHAHEHDERPLDALVQPRGHRRHDRHRQQRADEEAAQGQRADGEPLPVPGDGVRGDDHQQDDVDHETSPAIGSWTRVSSSRTSDICTGAGSGSSRSRFHGRSQPASASTRSRIPAVNPQTKRPCTPKPGSDVPAGVSHEEAVGGVEELGHRHPHGSRDLGAVDGAHG